MTITLRAQKGSELSMAEQDANTHTLDLRTQAGWNDIVSEVMVRSGPLAPATSNFVGGIYGYVFPNDSTKEAFANFHLPHDYTPGQDVYPHVHFSTVLPISGVVRFGFEATWANRYAPGLVGTKFPQPTTYYADFAVPADSDFTHMVVELPEGLGMPGAGMDVDSLILMRVFRDFSHVNDTFQGEVMLLTLDIHYPVSKLCTPNRVYPFI